MFWTITTTCVLAILGGGFALWLVAALKIPSLALLLAGPLAMAVLPPDIAAGLCSGAWLGAAFFMQARVGIAAPNEHPGWHRVLRDALGVNLAVLVGLIYVFRQRATDVPMAVLAIGISLAVGLLLCYLHATAWDIPREKRVIHGYLVGLAAFPPWAFLLAVHGVIPVVMGFFTSMILPPFFLSSLDHKLSLPHRHRRARWASAVKMPRRRRL